MKSSLLRSILITVLVSLGVFFLVHSSVQNYEIMSGSMEPDLGIGERVLVNKLAYRLGEPGRGDIVVFRPEENPDGIPFIKRVIGLPGEAVEVRAGTVFINGEPLEEPYIMDRPGYSMPTKTIGAGEYFVLGDNRNNSNDSHVWGTVARWQLIGKASFTIWPPSELGPAPNYRFA